MSCILLCVAIVLRLQPGTQPSTLPTPPELRQALDSVAQLSKRFENVVCEYEVARDNIRTLRIKVLGNSFLRTRWDPKGCIVHGRNSKYAFILAGKDEQALSLEFVNRWEEIANDRIRREFISPEIIFKNAYAIGGRSLAEFLNDPTCTLAVPSDWKQDADTIEIELSYAPKHEPQPPDNPPFTARVQLRRLSNQQWVIRKVTRTNHRKNMPPYGNTMLQDVEIDSLLKEPVPRKVRVELWGDHDGKRKTETHEQTITVLSAGPFSDSDFTLSAFGLLEPFGMEWERPTPWWLYAVITAGALLLLIFLLGIWKRRLLARS